VPGINSHEHSSKRVVSDLDHPIFAASIRKIRNLYSGRQLPPIEQDVLERLIHSSGDLSIGEYLSFSPGACAAGINALSQQAVILTDTNMASSAVASIASKTFLNPVKSILQWSPVTAPPGETRTSLGMVEALKLFPRSVVLIGSSPTALEVLLNQVSIGVAPPALVIGMPVGFIGVEDSKRHLKASGLPHIRLDGTRGGAGLVAAAANALLRWAWLNQSCSEKS